MSFIQPEHLLSMRHPLPRILAILTPVLLLLNSFSIEAEMFRCENGSGETTYQSLPCPPEAVNVEIEGLPPRYTESVEGFQLYGSTRDELYREFALKGPKCSTDKPRWGCTNWDVSWKFRWQESNGNCRVSSVQTFIKVVYQMPYWQGATQSDSDLAREWKRFYQALKLHEDGHGEIAIRAGEAIENRISQVGGMSSCSALEANVNQVGRETLAKFNAMNAEYDVETRHGIEQGADF
ncbi:MAG: putative secreted Zn-dependent protease [Candidatus Azotimanducaceae bacterium]|jgi:predicted secreted Zn-dependent protease